MSTDPHRIIVNQSIESRDLLGAHLLLWNLLGSSTPTSSKGPSTETCDGGVGARSASHVSLYKLVPAISCTVPGIIVDFRSFVQNPQANS